MENITDQQAVAIVIFGTFAIWSFLAWREERINKRCDEAWKAGYEMGLSVTKATYRETK